MSQVSRGEDKLREVTPGYWVQRGVKTCEELDCNMNQPLSWETEWAPPSTPAPHTQPSIHTVTYITTYSNPISILPYPTCILPQCSLQSLLQKQYKIKKKKNPQRFEKQPCQTPFPGVREGARSKTVICTNQGGAVKWFDKRDNLSQGLKWFSVGIQTKQA